MQIDKLTPAVTICIPTRNEEQNIGLLIEQIRQRVKIPYLLLVVDGNSTDRTREIASLKGAQVVCDPGGGKGVGIRHAINLCTTPVILFIDADGSHDPADIEAMVQPILTGQYDLVIGSRSLGGSDELHGDLSKFIRITGSHIITLGINYRFNVRLTDSQNGYRAIRTSLAKAIDLKEKLTTIEQEMLAKALHLGARVLEVPTHEYKRRYGNSCINVRKVWLRYVYSWLKSLFLPGLSKQSLSWRAPKIEQVEYKDIAANM